MMKKLFFAGLAALTLASCSTLTRTAKTAPQANTMIAPYEMRTTYSEVTPADKITGTSTWTWIFGIRSRGSHRYAESAAVEATTRNNFFRSMKAQKLDKVKKAAIYNALANTNYDILLDPVFTVEKHSNPFSKTISISVTGYGARMREIHELDPVSRELKATHRVR